MESRCPSLVVKLTDIGSIARRLLRNAPGWRES